MYLVIGGTSFIGIHTVDELLSHNCEVAVTGRNTAFRDYYESKGVRFIEFDLANKNDIEKLPTENIDGVILLAGLLPANVKYDDKESEPIEDYFLINTVGTARLLKYCLCNNIPRMISTVSYADVQKSFKSDLAIKETEPRNYYLNDDHSIYVVSKNAAADTMEYYNNQFGMKNAWFRLPTVYGVGPHGSLYVNGDLKKSGIQIFIEKSLRGETIEIFGDGTVSRDVVYVKDVAKAFYQALESDNAKGLYNITSGQGVSLYNQAKIITEVFSNNGSCQSKVNLHPEIINNSASYLFSIEKAKNDFGYDPDYSDFKDMMIDYKNDFDNSKYNKLFNYK
ncbi:NAD-dependent epimerase/dehydratase family protein [Facklamia hominis]